MTAVEWFFNEIKHILPNDFLIKYEQAKKMERQQIMTAFTQGDIFGADYYDGVNITEENYYNQTFKSE
jgi:hypothetical protein